MEEDVFNGYVKAGKIAAQALEFGKSSVKEGMLLTELADLIEKKIADLGGKIAFPVNLSLNDLAAHYHPFLNDKTSVKAEDYLKIDVGVHVDGYIGDTAATVRLAGKDELIICSEKMLENAIAAIRPGLTLGDLGEIIEETAEKFGFNTVRNLTGHSLDRFDVHAGLTIPNIRNDSRYQLREDEVIAIEPFCTSGEGFVKDSGSPLIFRWIVDRPSRMPETRRILELARGKYERLPFAKRWIQKQMSSLKVELAMKDLTSVNALYGYEPLREVSGKPVAQAEHSMIVREKPVILTSSGKQ